MTEYIYNYDPELVASESERYFHVPEGSIASKNRTRRVSRARRITFKVLRESGWSYGDIGHVYARHYSTVVAMLRNWKPGDDCIISPAVSDEDAAKRFPGYETVKPYLRYTSDPTK